MRYVYPNTIKTYLTPNHLIFSTVIMLSRQLWCSAVIRNLLIISSTTDKINRINNHFWNRWRHEYVVNLHETQRASKLDINSQKLCCNSLWWKGAQTLLENCHGKNGYYLAETLTQKRAIVRIKKDQCNPQTSRK